MSVGTDRKQTLIISISMFVRVVSERKTTIFFVNAIVPSRLQNRPCRLVTYHRLFFHTRCRFPHFQNCCPQMWEQQTGALQVQCNNLLAIATSFWQHIEMSLLVQALLTAVELFDHGHPALPVLSLFHSQSHSPER